MEGPLRLLQLPIVVQRMIFPQIHLDLLIYFTLASKKFHKCLQSIKIPMEGLKWSFYSKTSQITFRKGDFDNAFENGNFEEKDLEAQLNRMKHMALHLLTFLKVEKFSLTFDRQIDFENCFVWNITRKFYNFRYTQSSEKNPIQVSVEHLEFILTELEIKNLDFRPEVSTNELYQIPEGPLPNKTRVHIENSNWLDFRSFLNLDVENLKCNVDEDCFENANIILKQWIGGNHQNIKMCRLWTEIEEFEEGILQIFDGINTTESAFTQQEIWPLLDYPCLLFDITRESDGQLATVLLANGNLELHVWDGERLRGIGRL